MTAEQVNWFETPLGELTIRQLEYKDVARYAEPVLGVMATAYTREFEQRQGLVPEGSVDAFFEERKSSQVERMRAYMDGGSAYFVAHLGSRYHIAAYNLVGVIKTSHSRAGILQKLHMETPNCYVNDISVTKPRIGLGSALLAVATRAYHPNAGMAADVLPGSEEFFRQTNLIPATKQPSKFSELEIGGIPLQENMVRYHNPFAGVVTTRERLMKRKPWLADGLAAREP